MLSRTRAGIACLVMLTLVLAPAAQATHVEAPDRSSFLEPIFGMVDWLLQQLDSTYQTDPAPTEEPPPEEPPPEDPPDPPDDEKGGYTDPGG